MTAPVDLVIDDAEAMEALGARIASVVRRGDVVMLNGELGAGKTTFTRGFGAALGARGAVTSPTFVLARTHPTESGVPLVHVDAYRLGSAAEVDDLDLDFDGSITVVEWGAGKLDGAIDAWIEIDIVRPVGGDPEADDAPRQVRITAHGDRWRAIPLG